MAIKPTALPTKNRDKKSKGEMCHLGSHLLAWRPRPTKLNFDDVVGAELTGRRVSQESLVSCRSPGRG